jgi:hypothetical protein
MNGSVIAVGCNTLAFIGLIVTYVYRQGKTDGKLEQIDKRIDRIDRVINSKE